MNQRDEKSLAFRKWIFSALMVGAAVLLSPMFSFPLGVTRAFPLQHMINIFLAVLCGTRYSTSAAFSTALIRNLLGTGSLLAFPGSMVGAFLSGFLYSHIHKLWAAVLGEFVGTSIIGGLLSYLSYCGSFHGVLQGGPLLCIPVLRVLRRRMHYCLYCFKRNPCNSNRIYKRVIKYRVRFSFSLLLTAHSEGLPGQIREVLPFSMPIFMRKMAVVCYFSNWC
ncbi:energy coupling factor transporter S component ThiW [uncultured Dialister sp.]|uniref:energy coupling factor transporter S component ThiW n=1 Tax=uncultured Dialister sp. TaxID=278064 RepID=UPI0025F72CFD|nr:energy coupling factor transporter S component ThiW [uncultured Dialister sp.]